MQRRYITKHEWELVFKQLPDVPDYYRDRCMLFMTYIHGLRVSELTGLRIADIDIASKTLYIARLKNGFSTIHPLLDSEIRLIEKWLSVRNKKLINNGCPWLFTSNKGGRMSRQWIYSLVRKYGEMANLPIVLHPHTLRHACGYSLADQGMDTRLIQDYLGHRNIRHTVHYTASNPKRFRAYPIRTILLAILDLGSAQNPHVLRVRSGFCALSVSKLAAPITPTGIGS